MFGTYWSKTVINRARAEDQPIFGLSNTAAYDCTGAFGFMMAGQPKPEPVPGGWPRTEVHERLSASLANGARNAPLSMPD
jgi:hypothetical protein